MGYILMSILDYQSQSCQNCGHYSHCGTPLKKEFCEGEAMIIVCPSCRCDRCTDNTVPEE